MEWLINVANSARDIVTASDLSLNVSTELMGVLLSIPLSVFIAARLDRQSEKKRMRKALQTVSIDVRHELNYFVNELPQRALLKSGDNEFPGRRAYQRTVWAAQIANKSLQSSITSVRSAYGNELNDELRNALTATSWNWEQIHALAKLRLYNFFDHEGSTEEMVDKLINFYRNFFRSIVQDLATIEKSLKRKTDVQGFHTKIENGLSNYREFLTLSVDFKKSHGGQEND